MVVLREVGLSPSVSGRLSVTVTRRSVQMETMIWTWLQIAAVSDCNEPNSLRFSSAKQRVNSVGVARAVQTGIRRRLRANLCGGRG
eukprot:989037-Amphidinium_carterae.1